MDQRRFEVPAHKLRWQCDATCFRFRCTDELTPLQEFIGQDRAIKAIHFGLAVDQPGYNIFVTGMNGTGKFSVIKAHLESLVAERTATGKGPLPSDWCYIHNFADADRPKAVKLPPGKGKELKLRIERLMEDLRADIPKAFSGEDYEAQRKQIQEQGQTAQRKAFQALEEEARKQGFVVQFSPMGVALIPMVGGKPASQEEYVQLDQALRHAIEERRGKLMRHVEETLEKVREIERGVSERLAELNRRVADAAVAAPFGAVRKLYADRSDILEYLDQLRAFSIEHVEAFQDGGEARQEGPPDMARLARQRDVLLPFVVNAFVDNSGQKGPPIVVENNPTFSNLFGRIDRRFVMGGYLTDHTLLKPGSFQLANDGYLVLDMRHVLTNPLSWDAMKRVIKTKEVRPEDPAEALGLVVPQSIKPQPIPLNVKVVVTGDTTLHALLSALDEEFWETFKVKADFDHQIRRTPDHLDSYAEFVGAMCQKHRLLHFSPGAVGKVLEYAARLVPDQEKLSTRFGLISDLLIEADYWARQEAQEMVEASHVQKALAEKVYRSNLVAERIEEMTREGTILVDVKGEVVGQVNGLAVLAFGDFVFGKPSRITARTYLGRAGVINVEREAQLSGKTHDKGVLIIGGYLGWKYAQETPLAVSASIAFEQSYEGVDGDSASSTEVYAILSSLADVPLRQNIAVTGSVNQKGEVQPIGGVNHKIEGYFDLCKGMGLTGDQGVMVPKQNVRNLMLREDVVEACRQGRFHVYAVGAIDEGIELLTGLPAGERDAHGNYPPGTVNYLVSERLRRYAQSLRSFSGMGADGAAGRAGAHGGS